MRTDDPLNQASLEGAAQDGEGLSSPEAARRLSEFGPNAVPSAKESPIRVFLAQFWAPVPWMLEAAVVVQILLNEDLEAAVIGGLLVFNAVLSFAHRRRAEAALELLRSKLALMASVKRDGAWAQRPAAELVPGDVVKLSLGAVVPGDVRLISGAVLLDASALTGESVPSEAAAGDKTFAGALVRRGEAVAEVTATGAKTYFGRAAQLVEIAHAESAEQRAVLGVVRNLAILNGAVLAAMAVYGHFGGMPLDRILPLMLVGLLASVPVALPATFTLATALAAQKLARKGVLPTRLSAVNEAASMDLLCSDKTGTLTRSALEVIDVRPMSGWTSDEVLRLAVAASAEGGMDPVDGAIRTAATMLAPSGAPFALVRFTPFDPAAKRAEAEIITAKGAWRVLKGAFAAVAREGASADAASAFDDLTTRGFRTLAVAAGPKGREAIVGLIALSDPPREDSAPLISELTDLGIRTVMVTGDLPGTAAEIAGRGGPRRADLSARAPARSPRAHGLRRVRRRSSRGQISHREGLSGDAPHGRHVWRRRQRCAGASPGADRYRRLDRYRHRQIGRGDRADRSGLRGIVEAVQEGRATFQRILSYMLNAIVKKVETVLFLAAGLLMTGHAVLTPLLMVILLVANDFLTMSLTTDRARPSRAPERWRIDRITAAAAAIGVMKLAFLSSVLAVGVYMLGIGIGQLRTLAFLALVFGGQADRLRRTRARGHVVVGAEPVDPDVERHRPRDRSLRRVDRRPDSGSSERDRSGDVRRRMCLRLCARLLETGCLSRAEDRVKLASSCQTIACPVSSIVDRLLKSGSIDRSPPQLY